ncbi:hypothetical protein ACIA98_32330 [Streptomyces sp. NPDC051366]
MIPQARPASTNAPAIDPTNQEATVPLPSLLGVFAHLCTFGH